MQIEPCNLGRSRTLWPAALSGQGIRELESRDTGGPAGPTRSMGAMGRDECDRKMRWSGGYESVGKDAALRHGAEREKRV